MSRSTVDVAAKCIILYTFVCAFLQVGGTYRAAVRSDKRPVIGILAQELSHSLENQYGDEDYESFIAASYVKFVESAGSQVVPILINQPDSYYDWLFERINGALFPGGSTSLTNSGMSRAAEKIFTKAKIANSRGDYFPVWGTCLGMQLIMYLENGKADYRTDCNSIDTPLPLRFSQELSRTRLYSNITEEQRIMFESNDVSYNNHMYCFEPKDFLHLPAYKKYRHLTLNKDSDGLVFISTLEAINEPFYGVQFHPEKNNFEWSSSKNIPHSFEANAFSQYLATFFIEEARQNDHRFSNNREEMKAAIYNWSPVYTGKNGSTYSQIYFFKRSDSSFPEI